MGSTLRALMATVSSNTWNGRGKRGPFSQLNPSQWTIKTLILKIKPGTYATESQSGYV